MSCEVDTTSISIPIENPSIRVASNPPSPSSKLPLSDSSSSIESLSPSPKSSSSTITPSTKRRPARERERKVIYILDRHDQKIPLDLSKITERLQNLAKQYPPITHVNCEMITERVGNLIPNMMATSEIDFLVAGETASHISKHHDYGTLASRLVISNINKIAPKTLLEVAEVLNSTVNPSTGEPAPSINEGYYQFIKEYHKELQDAINPKKDYLYSYFGVETLRRARYLAHVDDVCVENLQNFLMRIAVSNLRPRTPDEVVDIPKIVKLYQQLSSHLFTFATPTLQNFGKVRETLVSCFMGIDIDDNIEDIYDILGTVARISKASGGVAFNSHKIRSAGSYIASTGGTSTGVPAMLKPYNATAVYVDQGGNKRKGAFSNYLEPIHLDFVETINMKIPSGKEDLRARDLNYGAWMPNEFYERVKRDDKWTMLDPPFSRDPLTKKHTSDVWGKEFEKIYANIEKVVLEMERVHKNAEAERLARGHRNAPKKFRPYKITQARTVWLEIINNMLNCSQPYITNKDHFNAKSNHQHMRTIKGSNLCCEIAEAKGADDEIPVCNLASIALPMFLKTYVGENGYKEPFSGISEEEKQRRNEQGVPIDSEGRRIDPSLDTMCHVSGTGPNSWYYDHKALYDLAYDLVIYMNRIIDVTDYPVPETRNSNMRHRPIGIGIQGLADAFLKMRYPFDSTGARQLNKEMMETIYYAALRSSCDLAKIHGHYESFPGSPFSKGILQFDMWNVTPSKRWDWVTLKRDIMEYGTRNSLLTALMPTATTSQILGFNECFEPYTTNLYVRKVLNGEYVVINHHLVNHLQELGLWNEDLCQKILAAKGSVQYIDEIPNDIKELYRTAFEIEPAHLLEMNADRGAFVDQSQSHNNYIDFNNKTRFPDHSSKVAFVGSLLMYAYELGIKTASYYLHMPPASTADVVTVDPKLRESSKLAKDEYHRNQQRKAVKNRSVVVGDTLVTESSSSLPPPETSPLPSLSGSTGSSNNNDTEDKVSPSPSPSPNGDYVPLNIYDYNKSGDDNDDDEYITDLNDAPGNLNLQYVDLVFTNALTSPQIDTSEIFCARQPGCEACGS